MLAVKWKIYKILNCVLLVSAAILFLLMLTVLIDNLADIVAYLVTCVFLLMIIQALINLYIISKTFPDKILTGSKLKWHITSAVINFISLLGLFIFLLVVIRKVTARRDRDDIGILIMAVCGFICLIDSFILISQFMLPGYLKKNSTKLFDTLINSIGSDTTI